MMKLLSLRQFSFIFGASILLAHFFISLGRSETIVDLLGQSWYYSDLFFVSLIVFVITAFIATVHYSLEVRFPMKGDVSNRFLMQGLIGVLVPALFSFVFTLVYMKFILAQDIFETSFFLYEFPISVVVILAINLVFVILSLLPKASRSVVMVSKGDQKIAVQITVIAGISKEGTYTLISTFDNNQYVTTETLEELMATLPVVDFFRANRQWIVHRSICGSYSTERSGKLELNLKAPIDKQISVSQKKGQEFKAWLAS